MANLSEEVNRIISVLEDSVEEKDWSNVERMIESLEDVYNQLDRQENGFNYDYE